MTTEHKPLTAAEAWRAFWEKRMLPDEAFIAPGYAGADDIAEFAEEYASAMLTPPPAEAVREAVERLETLRCSCHDGHCICEDIRTLLAHVQRGGLTVGRVRALVRAERRLMSDNSPEIAEVLRAEFPQIGEVK